MIDPLDTSKCLYFVKLNRTSFEQNPGKMELPKGRYVAEIRSGTFVYQTGYAADVEISHITNSQKRKLRMPELGKFGTENAAVNAYQGLAVSFDHDGGTVEVYNPRPAKQFHGRCEGNVVVAIWNGDDFGAPLDENGFNIKMGYAPSDDIKILVVTNNPDRTPYKGMIKHELWWQSNLLNIDKYNAVIFPAESLPLLYLARDNNCVDEYVRSGGKVFLVGSAIQYLSLYNVLPVNLPWYLGSGEYNNVAVMPGDMLVSGSKNIVMFSSTITVPAIKTTAVQVVTLRSQENPGWCVMSRIEHGKGKVVWSSYFMTDYKYSEAWNGLVSEQIDWLIS